MPGSPESLWPSGTRISRGLTALRLGLVGEMVSGLLGLWAGPWTCGRGDGLAAAGERAHLSLLPLQGIGS